MTLSTTKCNFGHGDSFTQAVVLKNSTAVSRTRSLGNLDFVAKPDTPSCGRLFKSVIMRTLLLVCMISKIEATPTYRIAPIAAPPQGRGVNKGVWQCSGTHVHHWHGTGGGVQGRRREGGGHESPAPHNILVRSVVNRVSVMIWSSVVDGGQIKVVAHVTVFKGDAPYATIGHASHHGPGASKCTRCGFRAGALRYTGLL